ncbi:hypothetical protein KY290_021338 [Solanum tuberosum]|uniref:Uncharacterized protein n=1 Tax=Solanum tuberosum TaxID=4113 RepID=A0ABQ7V194_SOLTU|nr:hypothetical protein KY289_020494 [Solanum tuberosum]KAH0693158.1 hypothetical protein KY285_020255 [Solanum tuberosum]KAH0757845.1 hypothetical protein KY290_021338 [Solanum tuberosum]
MADQVDGTKHHCYHLFSIHVRHHDRIHDFDTTLTPNPAKNQQQPTVTTTKATVDVFGKFRQAANSRLLTPVRIVYDC